MLVPLAGFLLLSFGVPAVASATSQAAPRSSGLQAALDQFVARPDGPPGAVVVVERNGRPALTSAGTAVVGRHVPVLPTDTFRLASVSKAYSGAVALSLVARKVLSLRDTIGKWLPNEPTTWRSVTIAQLLQHTSGIQDFSQTDAFKEAVTTSPLSPPPPSQLLSFAKPKLLFTPGTRYHYSNSDNILIGLIVQAATGDAYDLELSRLVLDPLDLHHTIFPSGAALPEPYVHGYDVDPPRPPTDVTEAFAAGWSWAAGAVAATPSDVAVFIQAYVRGALTDPRTHEAQFQFRPGDSEPPGPGTNAAGLAVFRYRTRCGTVYGHTGNTAGYTQFAASTADGSRSVVVSINAQVTPKSHADAFPSLRAIETLAVCSALS